MSKPTSLQDTFIEHLIEKKMLVFIYLVNGVKLGGYIESFDDKVILLSKDNLTQVVSKHAISTIVPVCLPEKEWIT